MLLPTLAGWGAGAATSPSAPGRIWAPRFTGVRADPPVAAPDVPTSIPPIERVANQPQGRRAVHRGGAGRRSRGRGEPPDRGAGARGGRGCCRCSRAVLLQPRLETLLRRLILGSERPRSTAEHDGAIDALDRSSGTPRTTDASAFRPLLAASPTAMRRGD